VPRSCVLPVFVIVNVWSSPCPMGTGPKSSEAGLIAHEAGRSAPVPDAATEAHSVEPKASVQALSPVLAGENRTVKLAAWPAPRL